MSLNGMIRETVIAVAVAVGIGTILLLLATKRIAGIQPSFGTALWASFIAHMLSAMVAFAAGYVLEDHLLLALAVCVVVQFFVQAAVLQVAIGATGKILPVRKAYILSVLIILADFFVVSPLIGLGIKAGVI
jgi:hypothetical protein